MVSEKRTNSESYYLFIGNKNGKDKIRKSNMESDGRSKQIIKFNRQ